MRRTTKRTIIKEAETGLWTLEDLRRVRRSKKLFCALIRSKEGKDAFFTQSNSEEKIISAVQRYKGGIDPAKITLVFNGVQKKFIPELDPKEWTEQEKKEYQQILNRN